MCGAVAWAQQSSSDGVILHEYFDPGAVDPSGRTGSASARNVPERTSPGSQEPPGLTLDPGGGDVIRGPEGPVESNATSPPYGPRSPRSGSSSLDDKTSRVDDLDYHANFDPSVFPYKRNVAQDRPYRTEEGAYRFETSESELEPVSVEARAASTREDTFWGSFLLRSRSGAKHPIPSVAPNQRVLEIRTEPEADVQIERDAAGNYYADVDYDGLLRMNMKVAAPRFYFTGRFRGDVAWGDFAAKPQPELETATRTVAGRVAAEIGVSRDGDPAQTVRRLVEYYRNFETTELPEEANDEDLYESISKRQIGVCRHRSMGFVLTARYLGIPARYVTNEAHAFVELWWPEGGWRRVDLGGAAREISYNGDRDDQLHDGAERDPLPKPERYREELQEMMDGGGDGDGGGRESGEESASNTSSAPDAGSRSEESGSEEEGRVRTSGGSDAGRRSAARSGSPDAGSAERRESRESTAEERNVDESSADPEQSESDPEPSEADSDDGGRRPTRLTLETESQTVFRGGAVTLHGVLRSASGEPLEGATVEMYFGRVGAPHSEMERLGTATTDAEGRYRVEVTVPETTGIGRWSLVARFPGDTNFQSARAE